MTEDILLVFVALLAEASVVFPVDAQVPCYQLGHQLRRIELLFLQLRRIELGAYTVWISRGPLAVIFSAECVQCVAVHCAVFFFAT